MFKEAPKGGALDKESKEDFLKHYGLEEEDIKILQEEGGPIVETEFGAIFYCKEQAVPYALKKKASETLRFIREKLKPRNDVNQKLLDEYEAVLEEFLRKGNIDILTKLKEIESRPTSEGADADFTDGTSLEFGGEYKALRDFFSEIEDLVLEYRRIEK